MERERGLKGLFIKYLVGWAAGCILLCGATFLLFLLSMEMGLVYPANYGQRQLDQAQENLINAEEIQAEDIPNLLEYALFTKEGEWKEGSLSGQEAAKAWEISQRQYTGLGQTFYRFLERKNEILVIRYQIKSVFVNPVLRKVFPAADTFIYILIVLEIIGCLLFMAVRFARMLERKMQKLQIAIEEIRRENLEFQVESCGIREIDRIGGALEHMKEALKTSLSSQWKTEKAKQEQISALTHDLKTPLTIARGFHELLLEGELGEEERENAEAIGISIRQMQEYVEQLLDVTKGRWNPALCKTSVDLQNFLEELQIKLQGMAVEYQIDMAWRTEHVSGFLPMDRDRIERAVLNVISNAMEYAGKGGRVRISADVREKRFTITAEDSGPGFTREALEKGKEEFYTGNKARTGGGHSGLGLFIADQAVKEHGGSLDVGQSAEYGGALVTLVLPGVEENDI